MVQTGRITGSAFREPVEEGRGFLLAHGKVVWSGHLQMHQQFPSVIMLHLFHCIEIDDVLPVETVELQGGELGLQLIKRRGNGDVFVMLENQKALLAFVLSQFVEQ